MSDRILTVLVMMDSATDMDDAPFNYYSDHHACLCCCSCLAARIAVADL